MTNGRSGVSVTIYVLHYGPLHRGGQIMGNTVTLISGEGIIRLHGEEVRQLEQALLASGVPDPQALLGQHGEHLTILIEDPATGEASSRECMVCCVTGVLVA